MHVTNPTPKCIALDLLGNGVQRTSNLVVSGVILGGSLAALYAWKSKLAIPAVLAFGAAVGAVALTA